ncbi:MAG TPA: ferritin [Flavilitoribacter sp.]|nr:ferritin [Flavilitoribacter sp.]HMQ86936.1 ferritin [Flavilitoribacter sp.]
MLSKKIESALNEQMAMEGYASFLYLSMAAWCDREAMQGCAAFMRRQSEEERQHMLRIFNYILELDGHPLTPAIAEPPHFYDSVQAMFNNVYEHEQKVTRSIHQLVELASEEKDLATFQFLQWYVDEQREEETLMRTILDRIKLIGDGPQCLYYIDKEVERINQAQAAADATQGAAT